MLLLLSAIYSYAQMFTYTHLELWESGEQFEFIPHRPNVYIQTY